MKVNVLQYTAISTVDNTFSIKDDAKPVTESSKKKQQPDAVDPVLGQAQQQLSSMPDIDMDRVNEMREAISNGQVSVNLDELTTSIQKYYRG
ncbi:flagellar biosynthesis anti-sigma factor FlgM [Enterobacter ludwigii]|uniref:flagellar biosynthesis anti-sigma factor FlgM n=1 Tax=Enterobacter ludwigii TaxID=299767 RepID=UPI003F6E8D5C